MKIKFFSIITVYLGSLLTFTGSAHPQSLDGISAEDRTSIEVACSMAEAQGPVTYHACLNRQLAQLGNDKAPNLLNLSSSDRTSIEVACSMAEAQGPATYHACLNRQLAQLGNDKAPNLLNLSSSDRTSIEVACSMAEAQGPVTYHACLNRQLAALGTPPSINPLIDVTLGVTSSTASTLAPSPTTPAASPLCAENGSCYGDISARTGLPKTVSVRGYYKSDGTYVRGYYRSK